MKPHSKAKSKTPDSLKPYEILAVEEYNHLPELVELKVLCQVFPEIISDQTGEPLNEREILAIQYSLTLDEASTTFRQLDIEYGAVRAKLKLNLSGCRMSILHRAGNGNLDELETLMGTSAVPQNLRRGEFVPINEMQKFLQRADNMKTMLSDNRDSVIEEITLSRMAEAYVREEGGEYHPIKRFVGPKDEKHLVAVIHQALFGVAYVTSDRFEIESIMEYSQNDLRVEIVPEGGVYEDRNIKQGIKGAFIRSRLHELTRPHIRSKIVGPNSR